MLRRLVSAMDLTCIDLSARHAEVRNFEISRNLDVIVFIGIDKNKNEMSQLPNCKDLKHK